MMKNKLLYQILLVVAILSFACFAIFYFTEQTGLTGPFLIIGLIGLAIAVRGFEKYKGFSYSLLILTAVTISMFYPK